MQLQSKVAGVITAFAYLTILPGCKKESNGTTNPAGNCKVKSITYGEITPPKDEFVYDNSGRVTRINEFSNNSPTWYQTLTYGTGGNVSKWEKYNNSGYIDARRTASFDGQGRVSGYVEINWDYSFGVRTDTSEYHFSYGNNTITGFQLYNGDTTNKIIRYYQNDNLVKMESYSSNGTLSETQTITYTNIINRQYDFEASNVLYYRALGNKNMPATLQIRDAATNEINYNVSYTYETNAGGYVTKSKLKYLHLPSTPEIANTYTYQCN